MLREEEGLDSSDEDPEEKGDRLMGPDGEEEEEEEEQLAMSVEISCSLWALDLLTWAWTRLHPEGDPPLR
jgi:hypothetical protein